MQLNKKKSNVMLFNFNKNFQFTSRHEMENEVLEVINETKLLGVIVNNRLDWDSNTSTLVKRSNARMRLLLKLVDFGVPQDDLERVQKNALKIILQDQYISYSNALNMTGLDSLFERRTKLSLKFAKSCLKNDQMRNLFPLSIVDSTIGYQTQRMISS